MESGHRIGTTTTTSGMIIHPVPTLGEDNPLVSGKKLSKSSSSSSSSSSSKSSSDNSFSFIPSPRASSARMAVPPEIEKLTNFVPLEPEHEHGILTFNDIKTHPDITIVDANHSNSNKKLDHSSSSASETSFEYPIQLGVSSKGHEVSIPISQVSESNQTFSITESEFVSINGTGMGTHPVTSSGEGATTLKNSDLFPLPSLPSEASPSDHVRQGESPKLEEDERFASDLSDEEIPISSLPIHGKSQCGVGNTYPSKVEDNDTGQMGPDSNHIFAAMDSDPGSIMGSSLGKQNATEVVEEAVPSSSSSSSESESISEQHFQVSDSAAISRSSIGSADPIKLEEDKRLSIDLSDEEIPVSSMPRHGKSTSVPEYRSEFSSGSTESATQYPTVQVMERHDNSASSVYKIPSHIFARTKSTAPMEWSVASNESLFSIHPGNMSFNRDQLCWLGKSGELYKPAEPATPPLAELSTNQPPTIIPTETSKTTDDLDRDPAVTEAKAAETMREVIRENSENRSKENASTVESTSHSATRSQKPNEITKSFAFPILTGNGGKAPSMKARSEKRKQQSQPLSQQPLAQSEALKDPNTAQTPKATKLAALHQRWLSCFTRCPFCSQSEKELPV